MTSVKMFLVILFVAGCSARHLVWDDQSFYLVDDEALEVVPGSSRTRRQAKDIKIKQPIAGNGENTLSVLGSEMYDPQGRLKSATGGFALDNVNGHGLSLTHTNVPGSGQQLAAAGTLNILNTDHKLDANAFAQRHFPAHQMAPVTNTFGGGLDYMYKDKVGGGLSVSHTPKFDLTDYSANAKFNLFKKDDTTFDINAGAHRTFSPFIPKTSWEPFIGGTFQTRW